MLFLINNPVLLVIGLVIVGFISFIGYKIVNEISLNNLLNQKHRAMRVNSSDTSKGFKKRIGFLTSTALAPIAVVALVLTLSTSNTVSPAGDILDLHNGQEVIQLYEDFESNMSSYEVFKGFKNFEAVDLVQEVSLGDDANYTVSDAYTDRGSSDYSQTNNQVIGVDEMDSVVTDGKYIYSINDNDIDISLAYTNTKGANALSNYMVIDYPDTIISYPIQFNIEGLFVDEDYLVVIGTETFNFIDTQSASTEIEYNGLGGTQNVRVYIYSIEDNFILDSNYTVSGRFLGSRKIDDNLIIVTNTYLPLSQKDIVIDTYLPFYQINSVKVDAEYENIVYIEGTSPNSYTSFYSLDLDHSQVDMEVILGDNSYNLYVSSNNIYLAGSIYYFAPMADLINLEAPVSETKTAIIKVAIDGATLEYNSMGVVEGSTLSQFSMDEYNGNLRVATTSTGLNYINNRLFVLDENLEELSRIENIGKVGERIKSIRFVGNYGYVVTFLQTDPFYVINMVDTKLPFIEGKLETPGFSSYLQPLNNDYMLGIGFGDNSGGINGLKIAIYDISDKTNPVVFSEVIFDYGAFGWGYSSATYNHKDLLVSMSKGIIALPFSIYDYNDEQGKKYNSGILVYNFDKIKGLTYSGYVQHEENSEENIYVYKSKFIADYFYTISNKYIQVSRIDDPESTIKSIILD